MPTTRGAELDRLHIRYRALQVELVALEAQIRPLSDALSEIHTEMSAIEKQAHYLATFPEARPQRTSPPPTTPTTPDQILRGTHANTPWSLP